VSQVVDEKTVNTLQPVADKTEKVTAEKSDLRPGEKVFTVLLFSACVFMFYRSWLLWKQFPDIDGPAMVPMMASALPALLLLFSVIGNVRMTSPLSHEKMSIPGKISILREYLISTNIVVSLIFIVCFCLLLSFGVPFYIVASVFLWGLMSFLAKGDYLKNVLWTALCMIFVAVVFGMLFNVVMP